MRKQKRYAVFARDPQGQLLSIAESSFSMPWSPTRACTWKSLPGRYFLPQHGHFIVCTTREYPDFYFTGKQDTRGNWEWKLK